MENNKRSRGWCFTLNNYTEEEFKKMSDGDHIKNLEKWIIGKEVGESGTKHLQGYYYFKNARALKKMKEIDARAHWETAKGSPKQNLDYCSKDGDYISHNMGIEIPKRKIYESIEHEVASEVRFRDDDDTIEKYKRDLEEEDIDYHDEPIEYGE